MANKNNQTLQNRVKQAMFEYSFLRWESATIISLTLILTALSFIFSGDLIPNWAWLLTLTLGFIAEGALVYTSLTDPETNRIVVNQMLKSQFNPEKLNAPILQKKVDKAFDYYSRIEASIRNRKQNILTEKLAQTASQIDHWLEAIYNLALRLDDYQSEKKRLLKDKSQAYESLNNLKQRLKTTTDAKVKEQIEITMNSLQRQLDSITNVENTMERAALQLENTIAALGTIHSQTMLTSAKDVDDRNARKLRLGIDEEVNKLDDLLHAMDEVHAEEEYRY